MEKSRPLSRLSWLSPCIGCFAAAPALSVTPHLALCYGCFAALSQLGQPPLESAPAGEEPQALFRYQDLVRDLILRAKVQDDHRALDLLLALTLRDQALDLALWADVIIACPSSLWGRLRGRLDIAAHLALTLGRAAHRPVLASPAHLYWRLAKRARLEHRQGARAWAGATGESSAWGQLCTNLWRRSLRRRAPTATRLLLVDDVVTTGFTLKSLAAILQQGLDLTTEFRLLALAATPSHAANP